MLTRAGPTRGRIRDRLRSRGLQVSSRATAAIPGHVLSAFQLDGHAGTPLGPAWDNGVRFGRVVVSRAARTAAWSGKARDHAGEFGHGIAVSRPVRATDGRLVVGGFKAGEFVEGRPFSRIDEAVSAALRYDDAMDGIDAPAVDRDDVFAAADRAVWEGYSEEPGDVVAHMDFASCLLYSGDAAPTLTDLVPSTSKRPRGFTAALVIVDGLLSGAVDEAVLDRWAHVPGLRELTNQALEYRLACAKKTRSNIGSIAGRVQTLLVSE